MKDEQGRPFIVVREYVSQTFPEIEVEEIMTRANVVPAKRRKRGSTATMQSNLIYLRRGLYQTLCGRLWCVSVVSKLGCVCKPCLQDFKGPRGLDKILISPDGDITVTNDGATILSQVWD